MPKISVIIPIYNVEKYLRQCLDSVVNQTLSDIEIICINDGSTDNSLSILKEYVQKDKRIILIDKSNTGQGDSRNIGMEVASGEYIAFLDSDDWLDLNTFEYVYNTFQKISADVVHFNFTSYNDSLNVYNPDDFALRVLKDYKINLAHNPYYNILQLKDNCFTNLVLYCGTRIYSSEFLKKFNIKFASTKNAEDHIFVNSVLLNTESIFYIDKNFYYYRIRKNSTVRSQTPENFCIFESIDIFKNYLIKNDFYQDYKDEFEKYKIQVYVWCYSQIPESMKKRYLATVREDLDKKSYKLFLKKAGLYVPYLQNIFSVKNKYVNNDKYKIVRIFFSDFMIKC